MANETRADIVQLAADCKRAERAAALRSAAAREASGRGPLTDGELALLRLEWLWSSEDDWRESSAPEGHMEPEWGGGAPT